MRVIPVLDLVDGLVVLASGGKRDSYRPIDTPLCPDPSPARVLQSMLEIFPFDIFYIADLDAIEGRLSNANLVVSLAQTHRDIEFWIDAGFGDRKDLIHYAKSSNIRFVIGSESLHSLQAYSVLCRDPLLRGHILSLDRKDGLELGSSDIINEPHLWPDTVISMDLTQVGQAGGPNLARIRELSATRENIDVVAAGGVRDINDLIQLNANGVKYALVATALHSGKLSQLDLARLR
jgi:phosphoribosylformimino-5-aminoimidazole carboxamide ribotide isomerase